MERESGGGGPYQGLEDRVGFMDIRVRFLKHEHGGGEDDVFLMEKERLMRMDAIGTEKGFCRLGQGEGEC